MRTFYLLPLLVCLLSWGFVSGQSLDEAIALQFSFPDSAIGIAEEVATNAGDDERLRSNALEVIGIALQVKGDLRGAYRTHAQAKDIREQLDWKKGIGHSLNNMGLATSKMGELEGSMELFLRALSIAEQLSDSALMARILGNIGTLYEEQRDYDRALDYYGKSLAIVEQIDDPRILGNTLHNIAIIYGRKEMYPEAAGMWKRTIAIRTLMGDDRGVAHALHNYGSLVHAAQNEYQVADSLYALSLDIYERFDDLWGRSMVLGSMGLSSLATGRTDDAVDQCTKSMELARELASSEFEVSACKCLADAYDTLGRYQEANRFLNRYVVLRDSINDSDSGRRASLLDERYAHEKEQLRQRTIAEEEIKRQHLLRNMSVALGMMGILLFFIQFNGYRKKQQANELLEEKNMEIEHQKEQLAEKNREVTDSIQYAKRLQDARLPRAEAYARHFSSSEVFYRPKDIVSGDFHWLEEVDGHVFIAVADCTGHGVPGAMVSMVGIQGLNRAVLEQRIVSPAAILQQLSDHVEEAFNKGGTEVRDGMDISLCVISPDRSQLVFAGANNALWQVSERESVEGAVLRGSHNGLHLHEWKAARRSIGGYFDTGGFIEHRVPVTKGDLFVLFSDGYADQFGGDRDRKLGSARFRKLVLEAASASDMGRLVTEFDAWKGAQEQVDDVSVVCFRI